MSLSGRRAFSTAEQQRRTGCTFAGRGGDSAPVRHGPDRAWATERGKHDRPLLGQPGRGDIAISVLVLDAERADPRETLIALIEDEPVLEDVNLHWWNMNIGCAH